VTLQNLLQTKETNNYFHIIAQLGCNQLFKCLQLLQSNLIVLDAGLDTCEYRGIDIGDDQLVIANVILTSDGPTVN
jgi:hypothetical protein